MSGRFGSWPAATCALLSTLCGCGPSRDRGDALPAVEVGARASATLEPSAAAGAVAPTTEAVPLAGSAGFRATKEGVDLTLSFTGCVLGQYYTVELHDAACEAALASEAPGDAIPDVTCTGTTGFGLIHYSRRYADPKPWSIEDAPTRSNLVGRVVVMRAVSDPTALTACGEIERVPATNTADPPPPLPPLPISSSLAGFCTWHGLLPTSSTECPDRATLVDCMETHCELSRCLAPCSAHTSCLEREADVCAASVPGGPCAPEGECLSCLAELDGCFVGFCLDTLACSTATPGGPCDQVLACCEQQLDLAQTCLDAVRRAITLGGDVTCEGVMDDWDFNTHLRVPCSWE